jgi:hypothetical protein
MQTKNQVVGWLLVEDAARVLVREADGHVSLQTASPESEFAQCSIQTGSFRIGAPIVDPVTRETVGYQMERMANPLAGIA